MRDKFGLEGYSSFAQFNLKLLGILLEKFAEAPSSKAKQSTYNQISQATFATTATVKHASSLQAVCMKSLCRLVMARVLRRGLLSCMPDAEH